MRQLAEHFPNRSRLKPLVLSTWRVKGVKKVKERGENEKGREGGEKVGRGGREVPCAMYDRWNSP